MSMLPGQSIINPFAQSDQGKALQQLEIGKCLRWLRKNDRLAAIEFIQRVGNAPAVSFRGFSDDELTVLKSLALIGLGEVIEAAKGS
jgi:hypothetical protein